jgi:OmpA-OmpF porin, OOP family
VDADDLIELQNLYVTSEVESRKDSELQVARQMLEKAEDDGAEKKVPLTFETAKAQIIGAERAIELSPHNASGYSGAVAEANQSARKLSQVLELAEKSDATEQAALTMWQQNEQIQAANAAAEKNRADAAAERARLEDEIAKGQSELENKEAAVAVLQSENQEYASAEELKQKIEELRKNFTPDEAEVLKQGNKLVVRLKRMEFTAGRSEIKPESFATLEKVEDLIEAVPVERITVEGHTDTSGPNMQNQRLSYQRAANVKKYLESQDLPEDVAVKATGFGSDRPLTSNKTKKGRAANRRVDIVIETPVVL